MRLEPTLHIPHQESLLHDPEHWKTGDEPMTTAQRSYLEILSREAGEPLDRTSA